MRQGKAEDNFKHLLVDKIDVHIRQIVARTVFLLSSTACLSKGN